MVEKKVYMPVRTSVSTPSVSDSKGEDKQEKDDKEVAEKMGNTVSILGQEDVYTVKYGLSPRNCPKGQPEGNPKGSGHILQYIPMSPNTDIIPFLTMIY